MPRTPFLFRVKLFLACVAVCGAMFAAMSAGELANDSWASRIRILPWAFTSHQQEQDTQRTYASNPLDGAKIAPLDASKVPAPR